MNHGDYIIAAMSAFCSYVVSLFISGLYVQLRANRDKYISIIDSVGMRLVVKEPGEYPFPGNEGINVPTGFEVGIALKYMELHYLGEPYKPCVATANNSWYLHEGEYSLEVRFVLMLSCLPFCL